MTTVADLVCALIAALSLGPAKLRQLRARGTDRAPAASEQVS